MKLQQKTPAAAKYLSILCFYGMTVLIPLYYRNAYFDIIPAKGTALCTLLLFLLPFFLIIFLLQIIQKGHLSDWTKDFCFLDYAMLFFFLAVLVSWLHSDDKMHAFWGNEGWGVGAFALMGCVICYFFLSRYLPDSQNLWFLVLIVNFAVFLMVIFHSMGIDLLSLHKDIMQHQRYQYLSTIGQINALMGYLSLLFPVFVVFFLVSKAKTSVILYGIFVFLGEASVLLCESDGIFIAVGVCMFFLLPFVWKEKTRMLRFLGMAALFGINITAIAVLPVFGDKLGRMNGVTRFFICAPIGIAVCLIAAAGFFITEKTMEKNKELWKKLLYAVESVMGIGVCVVLCYTIYSYNKYPDYWGSGRKYLWNYGWNLFCSFPWDKKLFGVGPELLGTYYEGTYEYFGATVLTAHSEFLQYLLTLGILGIAAWAGVCAAIVWTFSKYRSNERLTIAFFLALAAYFAQAAVCSPQAVTLALLCVMMSCFRRSLTFPAAFDRQK